MGKHKEVTYVTRGPGVYPTAYVNTVDDKSLEINLIGNENAYPLGFTLTRVHARLLAKRINQCLDETK